MDVRVPLVLHVIHDLAIGGLENGLVNIINSMDADRYRHAVVCIEGYSASFRERISRSAVEVIPLHRSEVGVWQVRRELYTLCRRLRPAIVHSRNMSGLDALIPAMLAGVRHRVHGEHGWDVSDLRGELLKSRLLRLLHAPFVSRYITVSRDLAHYLESRIGIAPERITHICNGVDTDRFHPAEGVGRRSALPEAFQDDDLFVVGTVGRVQAVKNQALLIRAFAAAVDSRKDLLARMRLVVVGDGPLLAELRSLATSLGLEALTWMPGAMSNVPEIIRSFDLFCLPSLNEGISNTILEALASGVPVAASTVGGNPELVDDGATGSLFAADDLEALADIIVSYAQNRTLCRQHKEAARRVAIERYDLSLMVSRYQSVYDGLLGSDR